jgi:hypothetical protein
MNDRGYGGGIVLVILFFVLLFMCGGCAHANFLNQMVRFR